MKSTNRTVEANRPNVFMRTAAAGGIALAVYGFALDTVINPNELVHGVVGGVLGAAAGFVVGPITALGVKAKGESRVVLLGASTGAISTLTLLVWAL